jgi:hypothetical protein
MTRASDLGKTLDLLHFQTAEWVYSFRLIFMMKKWKIPPWRALAQSKSILTKLRTALVTFDLTFRLGLADMSFFALL